MKKPFTPAAVHRLTKLAVMLGLVFSAPAFSISSYTFYYGLSDGNGNYVLEVNSDGKITTGASDAAGTTAITETDNVVPTKTGVLYGRNNLTNNVQNGKVVFAGGNALNILGGSAGNNAFSNTVTISGGEIQEVFGGYSRSKAASNNTVAISDGTISKTVYGGFSNYDTVSNNTVAISGGTIKESVYGGYSYSGTVSNNKVTIDGSKNTVNITGDIIGGASGVSTTENNTVNLINAKIAGMVYGGYANNEAVNTSNTITAKGINTVKGIDGFKTLELTIGKVNSDKGDSKPVLTISGTDGAKLRDKTIILKDDAENKVDNAHETVYLLKSDGGLTFSNTTLKRNSTFVKDRWEINESTINESDTLSGSSTTLTLKNNNVVVDDHIITPEQTATENTKTLSESLLGSVAMINQGAEFVADEVMSTIDRNVLAGKGTFGVINGGSSRYQTGSHVDVDTVSLAAGIAGKVLPNTTLAGFVEAGWASSTSHVSHAKGSGEHEYYGVGIAAKHTFSNPFYLDGSVRLGVAKTAFDGRYTGDKAHYNTDMFYTSAHVGGGYVFNLAEKTNLDLYGRYTVTWLESDSVKLHDKADTRFHMDSTTTHAVRGGLRLTGEATETLRWKVGLAYEHIFDGDADGQINGLALDTPTLEGDTGIGELGLSIKPSANSPWTFDVTAKGYIGDLEGFSGNLRAVYAF